MKILIGLLITVVVITVFYACKAPKTPTDTVVNTTPLVTNQTPLLRLKRGVSRGAEMYEIQLFADHSITYLGQRNVDRVGEYNSRLTDNEFTSILKTFDALNFDSLGDEYLAKGIADLQTMTVQYNDKTIRFHNRMVPPPLKAACAQIDNMAAMLNWVQGD